MNVHLKKTSTYMNCKNQKTPIEFKQFQKCYFNTSVMKTNIAKTNISKSIKTLRNEGSTIFCDISNPVLLSQLRQIGRHSFTEIYQSAWVRLLQRFKYIPTYTR